MEQERKPGHEPGWHGAGELSGFRTIIRRADNCSPDGLHIVPNRVTLTRGIVPRIKEFATIAIDQSGDLARRAK